jgi:hypothetical protein
MGVNEVEKYTTKLVYINRLIISREIIAIFLESLKARFTF